MTIEEAIEVMENILEFVKPGDPPEEHDAIELGMEALNRLQSLRHHFGQLGLDELPGETKSKRR